MKIAIAGAGVAGSYLGLSLQKKGHDVTIFESSKKENLSLSPRLRRHTLRASQILK